MSTASDLVTAVRQAAVAIAPDVAATLAYAIEPLAAHSAGADYVVAAFALPPAARQHATRILDAWARHPQLPGAAIALMLQVASETAETLRDASTVDVVWTGPSSYEVPTYPTALALADVIRETRDRLLLVAFSSTEVPTVLNDLRNKME